MTKQSQFAGKKRTRWIVAFGLLTSTAVPAVAARSGTSLANAASIAARPRSVAPMVRILDLRGHDASAEARQIANWVLASGDNLELPFVIIDKVRAEALAFGPDGSLRGTAPILIGLGRGDVSPPGIGQRRLATIAPVDRITPAGRFVASLGRDLGVDDVLWVDYNAAISLHRVVTGDVSDHRLARLASATISDNRISYGCINVPKKFFEAVVRPMFRRSNGIVYILPESTALNKVFPAAAKTAIEPLRP